MRSSKNQIRKIITAALLFLFMANLSIGQGINATQLLDKIILNPEYSKEAVIIKEMRFNKINDQKILDYMDDHYGKPRRNAALKTLAAGDALPNNFTKNDLYLTSSCNSNDIGVELGTFATWQGQTSCWNTTGSTAPCNLSSWVNATLPLAGRITIVPSPAADPCATNPGFPIPLPSPSGGNFSVKLGNNQVNAQSERITHQFIVQPSDTNFIYQYAVVLEDPGHLPSNQPFFDFVIKAQNGDTIPCSFQHYVAGGSIPGFQTSSNPTGCGGTASVYYKPWTTVGVNLGNYVGQQVTIICTTGDCSQCGHFGYTYLDFSCGTTSSSQFCAGTNSVTIVAPTEVGATYSWTPTGATTQTVSVNPQVIDTINVYVNPPSGCGYFVNYIILPTVITPAFTYTLGCTTANFSDATTITGGSISSWSWSFPGGSPSSSNSQLPPTITYSPGTYTVTLNIVSQAGCTAASIPVVITLQPPPTVSAGPDISVCGNNTALLNGSGLPAGGTYSWSPTTNLSSTTAANPTVGPLTNPATYTLTYTNSSGCKNSDVVTVGIGAEPVALASYSLALTCEGVGAQFKDSSLNATGWSWNFGDGTTSNMQNPPAHSFVGSGVHNVTLTASNGSCSSTIVIPVIVTDIVQYMEIGNVFTPNDDLHNNCFTPRFKVPNATELQQCITMEIFDRWGIKIFESENGTSVCWDGKTKSNTKAKDGTYYYIITLGTNVFNGYVTLIR